jgi:flagellar biosynthesis/type III secretory pathway chaperone
MQIKQDSQDMNDRAELVQQLAEALDAEVKACMRLIALTESEQDALISGDGARLVEIVSSKDPLVRQVDEGRVVLDGLIVRLRDCLARERRDGMRGLRALLDRLPQSERSLLERLLDTLDRHIEILATHSRTNALLLRHGFSQARSVVDMLSDKGGRSYSPSGEENLPTGGNPLVNYRA